MINYFMYAMLLVVIWKAFRRSFCMVFFMRKKLGEADTNFVKMMRTPW